MNNRRMLYIASPLFIFFFLTLLSCANEGKPRPMTESYIIDYSAPPFEKQVQLNEAIKFNRFTIATAYNSQDMVFRQDEYSIDSFNYNKWAVNPADMIADSLLRDIQSSGFFRAAFSRYSVEEGRYILQGDISEFFLRIEQNGKTAVMCVDITLKDTKQREPTKRILFQKTYRRQESLKDQTPRGYCQAMSQAAQNISRLIIADVYQAAKASSRE